MRLHALVDVVGMLGQYLRRKREKRDRHAHRQPRKYADQHDCDALPVHVL